MSTSSAVPAIVLLAGLAACAPARAPRDRILRDPMDGVPVPVRVDGPDGNLDLRVTRNADEVTELQVRAGADRIYAVLPEVYASLGLAANTVAGDTRTVGVVNGRAPRQVARQPLSRYLNCGSTMTGPVADAYVVTLTAVSRVRASGDSASVVGTQIAASAVPGQTSGTRVTCASTGRLEQAINKAVALRVAVARQTAR